MSQWLLWYSASSAPSIAPTNLISTAETPSTIALKWDPVNFTDLNGILAGYEVNYFNSSANVTIRTGSTQPTYTISNLDFGSTFGFRVAAISTGGTGPLSTVTNVKTTQDSE